MYTWATPFVLSAAVTNVLQTGGWTEIFPAWASLPGAGSNVDAYVVPVYAAGAPATWVGAFIASRAPATAGCGSTCASGGAARRIARGALAQLSPAAVEALRSGTPFVSGAYGSPLATVAVSLLAAFGPNNDATQLRPAGVSVVNWAPGTVPTYIGIVNCRAAGATGMGNAAGVPACRAWPAAPWIVEVLNEGTMSAAYWPVDAAGRLAPAVSSPLTVALPASMAAWLPSTSNTVVFAKNWAWRAGQQQTPGCILNSWPTCVRPPPFVCRAIEGGRRECGAWVLLMRARGRSYADACLAYGASLLDAKTNSLVAVVLGSQEAFPASCGNACMMNSFARRGATSFAATVSAAIAAGAGAVPYTAANSWSDIRRIGLAQFSSMIATSPGSQPYVSVCVGGGGALTCPLD